MNYRRLLVLFCMHISIISFDALADNSHNRPSKYGVIGEPTCRFDFQKSKTTHIRQHYQELLKADSEYAVYRKPYEGGFILVSFVNNNGTYQVSAHTDNGGTTLVGDVHPVIGKSFFKQLKTINSLHFLDRSNAENTFKYRSNPCAVVGIKLKNKPFLQGGMNIVPHSGEGRYVFWVPSRLEELDVFFADEKQPWIARDDWPVVRVYTFLENLLFTSLPYYYQVLNVPSADIKSVSQGSPNPFPEINIPTP